MCGICGYLDTHESNNDHQIIASMLSQIQHRGPDDSGIWQDKRNGLFLGHQRLSIIDLSKDGHQPMQSFAERYVIVFNGEIYNFRKIKEALEKNEHVRWRGNSDTEVLLMAISIWGLEKTLEKCIGMFAFALWDRKERILHLARDRMGEKPLYYGLQNGIFYFASELKAVTAHPKFERTVNREALSLFVRHNYIPAPWSIYADIKKLPPAHVVSISLKPEQETLQLPAPRCYWNLNAIAQSGITKPYQGTYQQAVDDLEGLLDKTIANQMAADVPVGAFLSGGYDSSLIVSLMQKQATLRGDDAVKTFTIGFNESGYDESSHARAVADHLQTDHTSLMVSADDAQSVIPTLPDLYDEPFSDSSQIPTYLVSKLARESVTVCLSGDGGDELFGGYNRYFLSNAVWKKLAPIPRPFRNLLAKLIQAVQPKYYDAFFQHIGSRLSPELANGRAGDKLHKLAALFSVDDQEGLYRHLLSHWTLPDQLVIDAREPARSLALLENTTDYSASMMLSDSLGYLPGDILTKLDRAAMAVSLETRVPLLDHRIVEFAWQLPMEMKIQQGKGKHILREVLYRHVPKEFLDRPKMGFGIPLEHWLRGPLRDWAEDLLSETRLKHDGFFYPEPIRKKWQEHLSGKRNWQYHLWDILVFQQWYERTK